jgi:hypothetical protein
LCNRSKKYFRGFGFVSSKLPRQPARLCLLAWLARLAHWRTCMRPTLADHTLSPVPGRASQPVGGGGPAASRETWRRAPCWGCRSGLTPPAGRGSTPPQILSFRTSTVTRLSRKHFVSDARPASRFLSLSSFGLAARSLERSEGESTADMPSACCWPPVERREEKHDDCAPGSRARRDVTPPAGPSCGPRD